jgi:hypothetical protein
LDHEIADYEAALRINPQLDQAAENLAEARVKRARRNAIASDNLLPSFDCKRASLAVEKAICSDPDLSRLDPPNRRRLQGRARQSHRKAKQAAETGPTELPCHAQQLIRQSAIQSAPRDGIAAEYAARRQRTRHLIFCDGDCCFPDAMQACSFSPRAGRGEFCFSIRF